jgi:hypothetical protein
MAIWLQKPYKLCRWTIFLSNKNINHFCKLEHSFYNTINLRLITKLVSMSNRYQTSLKNEDFAVMTQNACRRRRFCLWDASNFFESSPHYHFCLRWVSPQKKQDFSKLFAAVFIRSVRNHCVKILSQRLNYCYVDKLPKSIIICEQWNTLFIKRLNNLTWPYFYKKAGSPVLNVTVTKKFRMKG